MKVDGHEVLLSGIVGSTAYGLAGPDSDVDRLGVFAAPTSAFHGLHEPQETYVTSKPDVTLHEARKWCRLALGCNPTVMELVWLPSQYIELTSDLGNELRNIRSCFLSAKRVRDAYLGYASQQFQRLENRQDGSFSADTRKRTAKHARHLFRLCTQGLELYETGRLSIVLDRPAVYHAFGERVASGDINAARTMIKDHEDRFNRVRSPLGDRPDEERVERWLRAVRHAYWVEEVEDVYALQHRDARLHAELLAQGSRSRSGDDHGWHVPQSGI